MMPQMDFAKLTGVIPVVLQDSASEAVLSVGLMNRAALKATLDSGIVTLLGRRSGRLFVTRTATGEPAVVQEIRTDGYREALLVRVRLEGGELVCERGTFICFTESLSSQDELETSS